MDAEPAAMPSRWGGGPAGAGKAAARRAVPVGSLLPADSPRLRGEDRAHIRRLAETDQVLPPILVHRQTMRVIDGMHRLRAAVLKGRDRIDVEFFDGSDHEAFVRAVEANVTHGLPLSLRERKAAAARILAGRPDMSDRSIASITGLSAKTLAAIRDRSGAEIPHLNRRLGSDGRLRPLDAAEARRKAARLLTDNPGAPLRQIAGAAGISLGTASDVRRRLRSGQDPARTPQPSSPHKHRHTPAHPAAAARTAILPSLRKDPSLRLHERGRALLRWLDRHVIDRHDWPSLVDAIPRHRAGDVAELARQNADTWLELARLAKQRATDPASRARGAADLSGGKTTPAGPSQRPGTN